MFIFNKSLNSHFIIFCHLKCAEILPKYLLDNIYLSIDLDVCRDSLVFFVVYLQSRYIDIENRFVLLSFSINMGGAYDANK